jgi:hypothetical protein
MIILLSIFGVIIMLYLSILCFLSYLFIVECAIYPWRGDYPTYPWCDGLSIPFYPWCDNYPLTILDTLIILLSMMLFLYYLILVWWLIWWRLSYLSMVWWLSYISLVWWLYYLSTVWCYPTYLWCNDYPTYLWWCDATLPIHCVVIKLHMYGVMIILPIQLKAPTMPALTVALSSRLNYILSCE